MSNDKFDNIIMNGGQGTELLLSVDWSIVFLYILTILRTDVQNFVYMYVSGYFV